MSEKGKGKKPVTPSTKSRARDTGAVKPLGVELPVNILEALENCCEAKRWLKRVLVEEALVRYLTEEGFPPTTSKDNAPV